MAPMILRQQWQSSAPCPFAAESRAALTASLLQDIPLKTVSCAELALHAQDLSAGALPLGSVEFVRQAMAIVGVEEPPSLTYPDVLGPLLGRDVRLERLSDVAARVGTAPVFVKPSRTKLFTGFLWRPGESDAAYDEHDREQLRQLLALSTSAPDTRVFASTPITIRSEWRYYVQDGEVLGYARYDAGDDDDGEPAAAVLQQALKLMKAAANDGMPQTYGLDLARLHDGSTVLVEVNDAWALGLYAGAISADRYIGMLSNRWKEIVASKTRLNESAIPTSNSPPSSAPTRG